MPAYSPAQFAVRFWEWVDQTGDGCWPWTGAVTSRHPTHPYGLIRRNKRWVRAHRVAWELTIGPIPDGMLVCHHCDNTLCVRPAHLFLGTHKDNTRDMIAKGRHGTKRVHGSQHHKAVLTEDLVSCIRRQRAEGKSLNALAAEYGVSKGTIWQISTGRIWKHVPLGTT